MKNRGGKRMRWMVPVVLLILLEIFKLFPEKVEAWYTQGFYPYFGKCLRILFGFIPFSVGDLVVTLAILWILIAIVRFILSKRAGKWKTLLAGRRWGKLVLILTWLYISFHLFWGLNYYRMGSAHLLKLELQPYTPADLDTLMGQVHYKLEMACTDSLLVEGSKSSDRITLGKEAAAAYQKAAEIHPFLVFENLSLKPIMLGKLQAYAGYAGYIFPFTGEAHADFYVPNFTLPYTVCHEMAHQLGFGAESEANLTGFLAARQSQNPAFVYSAYAGVHQYILRELYITDSLKARSYIQKIPPILKKDRLEQFRFQEDHTSFLQPALDATYSLYLKGNNQPQGLKSYNRVVAWLIAYGKKYGWERI